MRQHLTLAHERPLDDRPAGRGPAPTGLVLGRDVPGAVEVGVKRETTLPALEPGARTPVVAGLMPAAATRLRGMPRINRSHRATSLFCLVLNEGFQLRERPRVQPARLRTLPHLDAAPDLLQVFQDNGAAGRCGLHDLLAQHVVAVLAKPGLLVAHLLEVPLGALGAALLEGALEIGRAHV